MGIPTENQAALAAARELEDLRITASVINPEPVDTGWMTPEGLQDVAAASPRGRVGLPSDTAAVVVVVVVVVSFLCSADGGWIDGQVLYSGGGLQA